MIQSYRDIEAYKRSYAETIELYRMTAKYPQEETYGMSNQIKRAAMSIPMNIAEGYGKRKESIAEFRRYLYMAGGSCNEILVLIDMSEDLGYISNEEASEHRKRYEEIGRMIGGLIKNWK